METLLFALLRMIPDPPRPAPVVVGAEEEAELLFVREKKES